MVNFPKNKGSRCTKIKEFENLRVCHVNAQSLVSNIDLARIEFKKKHNHIIAVSETWFKKSTQINLWKLMVTNCFEMIEQV